MHGAIWLQFLNAHRVFLGNFFSKITFGPGITRGWFAYRGQSPPNGSSRLNVKSCHCKTNKRILKSINNLKSYNYETIIGQLLDNYVTCVGQLWDNFGTILRQFWDNFVTTVGHLLDNYWTILQAGNIKSHNHVTITRQLILLVTHTTVIMLWIEDG